MIKPFNIYIGWDARESLAYEVLRHSIRRNTTSTINVVPLKHQKLRREGIFKRPWLTEATTGHRIDLIDGKPFSTDFSHTRFLVPHLNGYKDWALFLDCDMLFTCDIKELFREIDNTKAVMCVKHRHSPKEREKMDGQPQAPYYRKNWSSFFLVNCGHPANKVLTPDYVNTRTGSELHAFSWLDDEHIGPLPYDYNWIKETSPVVSGGLPKVIHYTTGGPWFDEVSPDVDQSDAYWDIWEAEFAHYKRYGEDLKAAYTR